MRERRREREEEGEQGAQGRRIFCDTNFSVQLKNMITKRLKLNYGQTMLMVRDGDIVVDRDDDLEDGMHLDVFIDA